MDDVHKTVTGNIAEQGRQYASPGSLKTPPCTVFELSPALTPSVTPLASMTIANSPNSSKQFISDDSGICSGVSSPATVLNVVRCFEHLFEITRIAHQMQSSSLMNSSKFIVNSMVQYGFFFVYQSTKFFYMKCSEEST